MILTNLVSPLHAGVIAVASGAAHSAILKQDGTVWTSGANNFAQLGLNLDDMPFVRRYWKTQLSGLSPRVLDGWIDGRAGRQADGYIYHIHTRTHAQIHASGRAGFESWVWVL